MKTQRVLVVHRQSLFAEVVARILRNEQAIEVIELTIEPSELLAQISQLTPDLLVVDSQDAGLDAHALVPPLLERHPSLRALCLNMGQPCANTCPTGCRRVNTKNELVGAIFAKEADASAVVIQSDASHGIR